jgi:hypothetical protein
MNKHILLALTVVSTMGFAVPAVAAPGIVSKTELKIPAAPPQTILNRFYKLIYPEKAATTIKPFAVNFQEEIPCGDTVYRLWTVEKNLKVPFVYNPHQGTAHTIGAAYQAVRNGNVKWGTTVANTGSGIPSFLACNGRNVLLDDAFKGMLEVAFEKLETPASWNVLNASELRTELQQIDGIVQKPGKLYIGNSCTNGICSNSVKYGSSRIFVMGDNALQSFSPPHYRNLLDPSVSLGNFTGGYLSASFYRMHDGFLVIESVARNVFDEGCECFTESNGQVKTSIYRIHDGETAYTKLVNSVYPFSEIRTDLLPMVKTQAIDPHGLVVGNWQPHLGVSAYSTHYTEKVLIHGFTYTNENPVIVSGLKFLWETPTMYAVRYQINSKTGGRHYWQAVVRK